MDETGIAVRHTHLGRGSIPSYNLKDVSPSIHLISFGDRLAYLAYHVHKWDRKTVTFNIF